MTYDGTTTYTYDAEGRVTTANNSLSGSSSYVYDAEGRRTQKTTSAGGTVNFLYDLAGHEITQISAGSWQRGEIYAGDHHVATYYGGTTYFTHADWLGTERARSNVSGALCESIISLPYGDAMSTSGNCGDPSPMHFTGREHDIETGLEYFGARYDSSSMGRFMTPDWSAKPQGVPYAEFGDPGSLNLYVYVRNNPMTRMDRDGHCLWDLCIVEGVGLVEAGTAVVGAISAGYAAYKAYKWTEKMKASENSDANKNVVNDIVHPNEHPEQTIDDQTKEIQNSTLDPQKQGKDTLEGISKGADLLNALPGADPAGAADKLAGKFVEKTNDAVGNTAEAAATSMDKQQQPQQQQQQQKPTCHTVANNACAQ